SWVYNLMLILGNYGMKNPNIGGCIFVDMCIKEYNYKLCTCSKDDEVMNHTENCLAGDESDEIYNNYIYSMRDPENKVQYINRLDRLQHNV
ncbi:hypothetical protein ACJX0J_031478, partial [Zea mays]